MLGCAQKCQLNYALLLSPLWELPDCWLYLVTDVMVLMDVEEATAYVCVFFFHSPHHPPPVARRHQYHLWSWYFGSWQSLPYASPMLVAAMYCTTHSLYIISFEACFRDL